MPCPFCGAPPEARPGNSPYQLFECGTLIADGKTYQHETCEDICKHKPKMLYIWPAFSVDYYGGLAFAIANDPTEAKKLVIDKLGYTPTEDCWQRMLAFTLTESRAFVTSGEGWFN